MTEPIKGTIFTHQRFLDPSTNTALQCKITVVRSGRVYFRPFYGTHEDGSDWLGTPYYLSLEEWEKRYAIHHYGFPGHFSAKLLPKEA